MKSILRLNVISIFSFFVLFNCNKKKSEDLQNPILGSWLIKSEQYFAVKDKDTLFNNLKNDGRHIKLKENNVLGIYWKFPTDYEESIWKLKDDSIFLYFDGPNSQIVSKYKFKQVSINVLQFEETNSTDVNNYTRSIFTVNRE